MERDKTMEAIEERAAQWNHAKRLAKEMKREREAAIRAAGPKFTLFPDFPEELRALIWSKACEESRTVDLWTEKIESELQAEPADSDGYPFKYRSSQKHPSILQVSQEARGIALSLYTLTFGTTSALTQGKVIASPPRIYVNWAHDLILLRDQGLNSAEARKLHNGMGPRNTAAINDLNSRSDVRRFALCVNEAADLHHHFFQMKIDEVVLYWGEFYPSFERWEKYEPFRLGALDLVDNRLEVAAALRLENNYRRSLHLVVQFRDDHITDPEEQIDICAGMVDFTRLLWVQIHGENYPGSEVLKFRIARAV